jgi:hypothetical protein
LPASTNRLRSFAPWLVAAFLYALFRLWYDGVAGPLAPAEVDGYVARMTERGFSAERIETIRAFLAADDGRDFVMVNFIAFADAPAPVGDMQPGESGRAALDRYMAYMTPALLARASHPILGGDTAASAIEAWGVPGAERWSMAGVVRYRSRRDMMQIATDPRFRDAHVYKTAAMEKTIAVPVAPYVIAGGPRLVVALALFALAALGRAALARPSAP